MLFYVFQNDEEQIYVLSFAHHVECWRFNHRNVDLEQLLIIRVRDFELIKIESEIFNCIEVLWLIDRLRWFFVFWKKINRWLIKFNIFSKTNFNDDLNVSCRILDRVARFEVIWLIRRKFPLERNVFFLCLMFLFSSFLFLFFSNECRILKQI